MYLRLIFSVRRAVFFVTPEMSPMIILVLHIKKFFKECSSNLAACFWAMGIIDFFSDVRD